MQRSPPCLTPPSTWTASSGLVLADDLAPVAAARAVGVAPADARPDDDGLEGARLVPRPALPRLLFDGNGNAGPTVWWDGRVVGGWSQRKDGEIVFRILEDVGKDGDQAVEAEAERLASWLGDVRLAPGFLPPFQRALSA